jgi:hypothetical protein
MKMGAVLVTALACLPVAACALTRDEFIIYDPEGRLESAEIDLCGRSLQMVRSGTVLKKRFPINCEGSGAILVRVTDGQETTCLIGYVTPRAGQVFEFSVADGICR